MWIAFNKLVSRYTKQAILHDANVSMTTQPTPKENTSVHYGNYANPKLEKSFLVYDVSLLYSML